MKKVSFYFAFFLFLSTKIYCQLDCAICKDILVNGTYQTLKADKSYLKDFRSYILNYSYSEFKKSQGTSAGIEFEGFGFNFGDNESQYELKKNIIINSMTEKIISSEELAKKWGDATIVNAWSACINRCSNEGFHVDVDRNGEKNFTIKLTYKPGSGMSAPVINKIYLSNAKLITASLEGENLDAGTKIISGQIIDKKIGTNISLSMKNANDFQTYLEPKLPPLPDISGQWFRTTDVVGKLQIYTITRDNNNPKSFNCKIDFEPPVPNFTQIGNGHFENDSTVVIRIFRVFNGCESFWDLTWKIKDVNTVLESGVPTDYSKTCDVLVDPTQKPQLNPLYKR